MLRSSLHCLAPGLQICSGPVVDEPELLLVSAPVEVPAVSPDVLVDVVLELLVLEVFGSVLVTGFVVEVVDIVAEPLPLSVTLVVGGVVVASLVAVLDWVVLVEGVVRVEVLTSVPVEFVPSSLQAAARSERPRNLPECFMISPSADCIPGERQDDPSRPARDVRDV
jgi:hypothetical protein